MESITFILALKFSFLISLAYLELKNGSCIFITSGLIIGQIPLTNDPLKERRNMEEEIPISQAYLELKNCTSCIFITF